MTSLPQGVEAAVQDERSKYIYPVPLYALLDLNLSLEMHLKRALCLGPVRYL